MNDAHFLLEYDVVELGCGHGRPSRSRSRISRSRHRSTRRGTARASHEG
jgi:hypothetical protein